MTTLRYSMRPANPDESFGPAPDWQGRLGDVGISVRDGVVEATTDRTAAEVEQALRAWQLGVFLSAQHEIWFEPLDGGPVVDVLFPGRDHVFRRSTADYPRPDQAFEVSPTVDRLLEPLRAHMSGSAEPVATAAAVLESLGETAEASYNIEAGVLATLRDLVGRGSGQEVDPYRAFRGPEWQWLQEAVRLVMLQVARSRPGAPPQSALTMASFSTEL